MYKVEENVDTVEEVISDYYGLEHEKNDEEEGIRNQILETNPFNPEKIRVDQQMFSLKYVYELMDSNNLEISPSFQRKSVWKENRRKSLLIESLILRIPIPAFYFYENEDSVYLVIDGQQRLRTIRDYLEGKFSLSGLEYLDESCGGKKFKELDTRYQQRIYRTQLAVNVLDVRSPKKVIYDIFRRVNTGGVPLTPQEIRNAVSSQAVREFLKEATNSEEFLEATRRRIKDDRMDAQELALRFFAFYDIYDYEKKEIILDSYPGILTLLDRKIEHLNEEAKKPGELEKLMYIFKTSMKRCGELFGEHAFAKVYEVDEERFEKGRDIINKSLFISFSVILADPRFANTDMKPYRNRALSELADQLLEKEYFDAITVGTGDKRRIYSNFKYSNEVINNV